MEDFMYDFGEPQMQDSSEPENESAPEMTFGELRAYVSSHLENTQQEVDWTAIVDAVYRNRNSLRNQYTIFELRSMLVSALFARSCEDEEVAVRLTDFCARVLDIDSRKMWHAKIGCLWMFESDCQHSTCRSGTVSRPASWAMVPLSDADITECVYVRRPGYASAHCPPRTEEAVKAALKAGDDRFLSVLVRYGFWNGAESPMHWSAFLIFWVRIRPHVRLRETHPNIHVSAKQLCQNLETNRGRMSSDTTRGFRRILLITRTLRAVMLYCEHSSRAEPYAECLRTYFATVPDPLVSADEVEEFLFYLLGEDGNPQEIDKLLRRWVDRFGSHHYMPRSLTHLCRVTARRALVQNQSGLLPGLVETLPIPGNIKKFILGAPLYTSVMFEN